VKKMARPIGNYEIRFALSTKNQNWCGIPGGSAYKVATEHGFTDCAIVLPAYTAEDAAFDLSTRLASFGWKQESVIVESVAPTTKDRPGSF